MTRPPTEAIVDWYESKTEFLLEKYGPGPRVHYHTGLTAEEPAATRDELRRQIVESQEAMLRRAAAQWDGARGELLDVGCGLGGTALFFAAERNAIVTALSPVPRHLEWVERFARQAGVGERVIPLYGDAHELDGPPRFDAALSFGATTYFDRTRYFERLARVVRPKGWVFIEDTFLGRPELAAPFNQYWTSNIGWPREYEEAAARSGFTLTESVDVSREAAGFWRLSVAYSELQKDERRIDESVGWQSRIHRAYLDGGLRNLLLSFQLR
jgi:cyclopropane fatty-acyl-phospholipid synthase-like methyltransferase